MPGQGRLGDKANISADAHGCPGCPHPGTGPAIMGSPDVFVNGRPALRVDDMGIHAVCCGPNMWKAQQGAPTVFINGKAAFRMNDPSKHCGGQGQLIEGSSDVIVGDSGGGGSGAGAGGGGSGSGSGSGGQGAGGQGAGGGASGGGQGTGSSGGGGAGAGAGAGAAGASGGGNPDGADPAGDGAGAAANPPAPQPIDPQTIQLTTVNTLGQPQQHIELDLTLPDGTRKLDLTRDDGTFTLSDIQSPGQAHLVLPDFDKFEDTRAAAATPGALKYSPGGVSVGVGKATTVELPPQILRGRLTGMLFDIDKTFLLPPAMNGIRELIRFYAQHPKMQMLVTGHCDLTGQPGYNLTLSQDRAKAIADYVTDNVDGWLPWYSSATDSKRWGTREDQMMLSAISDGSGPFYTGDITGQVDSTTQDAVRRYQGARGLAVDGFPGPDTRRQLVTDYMKQDGTTLPAGVELATHGCGEFHPVDQTGQGVSDQQNRRVEIFLFEAGIDPAPVNPCPSPGCSQYPEWVRRTVLTVDLDLPPGTLTVDVVDPNVQAMAGVEVHVSGVIADDGSTDASGSVKFDLMLPGDYTVLAQKDGFQTPNTKVTIASGQDARATLVMQPAVALANARWEPQAQDDLAVTLRDKAGRPCPSCPATVTIGGATIDATSDAQGVLATSIPSGTANVGVTFAPPGALAAVTRAVVLAPAPGDDDAGAVARLVALGYPGDTDRDYAVFQFQVDAGAQVTATLDAGTRAALKQAYGS